MKIPFLVGLLAFLVAAPFAGASITDWNCGDDGDGVIVMEPKATQEFNDLGNGTYELKLDCVQTRTLTEGVIGHIDGEFIATPEDPTVYLIQNVENDTDFTWTDYHITIGMNKAFSIVGVVAPPDWTWTTGGPTGGQQLPNKPPGTLGWVGTVDYFAGTPIPIGSSGTFGVIVSFIGTVEFCTEQYPTPEPASLLLLGLGGLLIRRRK